MTEKGSEYMEYVKIFILFGIMMWSQHTTNTMKSYKIQLLEKQIEYLTK